MMRLAIWSSMGQPRNTMRSLRRREKMSKALSPRGPCSMT